MNLITAANQISKALDDNTLIPLYRGGYKRLKEIQYGDVLIDSRGEATSVIDIPYVGEPESYLFEFDDGTTVTSSGDHVWIAKDPENRFRKQSSRYDKWQEYTTAAIISRGKYFPTPKRPRSCFSFPVTLPVERASKRYKIHPYLLGLIIGDGGCSGDRGVNVTNPDPMISEYLMSVGAKKMNVSGATCDHFYIPAKVAGDLKRLGLQGKRSWEKFIPREYFDGSVSQRKELLHALMDTDGMASKGGVYQYSTSSPQLAEDVRELVASLGGKTRLACYPSSYTKDGATVKCRDSYIVSVLVDFNPFKMRKKRSDRWHPIRYKLERVLWSVTPRGKVPSRCLTVDSHDGSFLVGREHLVTRNSSTQIRKCIHHATAKSLWPKLWKTPPKIFWYFYPSFEVATVEVETKWIPEFLPRGPFKDDPVYGWRIEYSKKMVHSIIFNSGVTVYFKSYSQNDATLQSSTVHEVFADEEMPEELYPEIAMRLAATDGYFNSVFTATRNQDMWRRAMEGKGDSELFPEAFKQTISMYDCLVYEDGSPSPWSIERIKKIEETCGSQTEIDRRVHGRFVTELGRKYPSFDAAKHYIAPRHVSSDWRVYSGVDIGSGGSNHPPAIVFIAVNPDGTLGWVVDGWRGDDGNVYTAGEVFDKYRTMARRHRVVVQAYDPHSRDFGTIAERAGMTFVKADKRHDYGEDIVNTLFKNCALLLFDTPEIRKLGSELVGLQKATPKTKAKDDFCDALRYAAATQVPWDWETLHKETVKEEDTPTERAWTNEDRVAYEMKLRRGESIREKSEEGWDELEEEIAEWNEAYYA